MIGMSCFLSGSPVKFDSEPGAFLGSSVLGVFTTACTARLACFGVRLGCPKLHIRAVCRRAFCPKPGPITLLGLLWCISIIIWIYYGKKCKS